MGITDMIADFIESTLNQQNGNTELKRSELANMFGCVPSQINYVISTRFSPERGYVVESRRGGGGYIRIRRVRMDPQQLIMHTVNAIGDRIDAQTTAALVSNAVDSGALSRGAGILMLAATDDNALRPAPQELRDMIRASILKQMLIRTL